MNDNERTAAGQSYTPEQQKERRKRWMMRIALALMLIIILLLTLRQCGVIRYPWEAAPATVGSPSVGGNIQEGTPGMTMEEIIAEMQKRADESMVSIQINARPVFEDGNSEGDLYIVNPANNAFHMQFAIRLDSTDELLYDTGIMAPNHYVNTDKLFTVLKKGEYPATAYIYSFKSDNLEQSLNTTTASLIITVKN